MIPLSKLRNASIGIRNHSSKKHCMLVCYKCCMFAAHYKSFNLPYKKFRTTTKYGKFEFYQSGFRIFLLLRFEIRNRFATTNEQNQEEEMGQISCRGAVAVWELPAAALSQPNPPSTRSTRSNFASLVDPVPEQKYQEQFLPYCQQCTVCSLNSTIPLE